MFDYSQPLIGYYSLRLCGMPVQSIVLLGTLVQQTFALLKTFCSAGGKVKDLTKKKEDLSDAEPETEEDTKTGATMCDKFSNREIVETLTQLLDWVSD